MRGRSERLRAGRAGLVISALAAALASGAAAQAEKRTVFKEGEFHWQANLKAGQTLEVIGRNGEIDATAASGEAAQVDGHKRNSEGSELFVEVVEYPDGVTICAVYAKDPSPGRCHRGGVDSEHHFFRNEHAKLNFDVRVPRGVAFKALTTNGGIRCRDLNSVVTAGTTNGDVEVSTSEWASARTTNGGLTVSIGSAKWTGEVELLTTNGSVHATLPASAEFRVSAATTNGGIHTDFPITVSGSLTSKSLSGTVGAGGRELHVATTNGGIELRKHGQ